LQSALWRLISNPEASYPAGLRSSRDELLQRMVIEHSNLACESATFSAYTRYINKLDAGCLQKGREACLAVIDD
jgi:hypothetical protein